MTFIIYKLSFSWSTYKCWLPHVLCWLPHYICWGFRCCHFTFKVIVWNYPMVSWLNCFRCVHVGSVILGNIFNDIILHFIVCFWCVVLIMIISSYACETFTDAIISKLFWFIYLQHVLTYLVLMFWLLQV